MALDEGRVGGDSLAVEVARRAPLSVRTRLLLVASTIVFSTAIYGLASTNRFGAATLLLGLWALAVICVDLDRAIVAWRTSNDGPTRSALGRLATDVPHRRAALVVLIVIGNIATVAWFRSMAVWRERQRGVVYSLAPGPPERPVPPWEWTADEWRDTVWPWK